MWHGLKRASPWRLAQAMAQELRFSVQRLQAGLWDDGSEEHCQNLSDGAPERCPTSA